MVEKGKGENRVVELGNGLELWKVRIGQLREQDRNARVMPQKMMERLALTIKDGRRLEALPFCALTDKGIEIISGHHRVRAARMAGLTDLHVIVDTTGLTPSQIKAKQLAHNAIQGTDDKSVLKELYEEIDGISEKLEAFVGGELESLPFSMEPIKDISVAYEWKNVLLTFLPSEFEDWETLLNKLNEISDTMYLIDDRLYTEFTSVAKAVTERYNCRSISTIMAKMMAIVRTALEQKGE